jgi:hypothetical protein
MTERSQLRSGARYNARNRPYYSSVSDLLSHHQRLLISEPAVTTRSVRIAGLNVGSLLQTTARFTIDSTIIRPTLRNIFFDLFREHTESSNSGFEVVITFNAILTNSSESTFSLFYGHDHRASNIAGAAPELSYGETVVVRTLLDIESVPTVFSQDELRRSHRHAFENSNVHVHSFINIVYLIYRFIDV